MRATVVGLAALASALAFAPAASAESVSGTLDSAQVPDGLNLYLPFGGQVVQGGTYEVSFAFSRPSFGADLEAGYDSNYAIILLATGQEDQGSSDPQSRSVFFSTPVSNGELRITVLPSRHFFLPNYFAGPAEEYDTSTNAYARLVADFPGSDPVDYRLTVARVPEPAAWALMILGFGGAGAALRRRAAHA